MTVRRDDRISVNSVFVWPLPFSFSLVFLVVERCVFLLWSASAMARAATAASANPCPGYATNYGNPEMGYGASPYPNPYGMPQVQSGVDLGHQYVVGAGAAQHNQFELQTVGPRLVAGVNVQ
ncbi:hypothetical protein QYF36_011761 [Acer negundo]|nr:hypothetical protein QYF36_011761 [Acer negundo]